MVFTGCLILRLAPGGKPAATRVRGGCFAGGSMSKGSRQLEHVGDAASEEVRWVYELLSENAVKSVRWQLSAFSGR